MRYKDVSEHSYFVAPANPAQLYKKHNDNHAFEVPENTTLELGRVQVHVDPNLDVVVYEETPPATPKSAKR